jgi:hypothetical protein
METSNKIDLDQFKSRPHPFKTVFKNCGVAMTTVSNYLGVSYAYTYNILSGHYKMPRHLERKLEPLVKQLLAEEVR